MATLLEGASVIQFEDKIHYILIVMTLIFEQCHPQHTQAHQMI